MDGSPRLRDFLSRGATETTKDVNFLIKFTPLGSAPAGAVVSFRLLDRFRWPKKAKALRKQAKKLKRQANKLGR